MTDPSATLTLRWVHDCSVHGEHDERLLPLGPSGWTLVQVEPLTVSPSILCGECRVHGFIRDGQWVPA